MSFLKDVTKQTVTKFVVCIGAAMGTCVGKAIWDSGVGDRFKKKTKEHFEKQQEKKELKDLLKKMQSKG